MLSAGCPPVQSDTASMWQVKNLGADGQPQDDRIHERMGERLDIGRLRQPHPVDLVRAGRRDQRASERNPSPAAPPRARRRGAAVASRPWPMPRTGLPRPRGETACPPCPVLPARKHDFPWQAMRERFPAWPPGLAALPGTPAGGAFQFPAGPPARRVGVFSGPGGAGAGHAALRFSQSRRAILSAPTVKVSQSSLEITLGSRGRMSSLLTG